MTKKQTKRRKHFSRKAAAKELCVSLATLSAERRKRMEKIEALRTVAIVRNCQPIENFLKKLDVRQLNLNGEGTTSLAALFREASFLSSFLPRLAPLCCRYPWKKRRL